MYFIVPKEFQVYRRERDSKLYHVSALCLAKSVSELPLSLIQPFVYMSVIYWVANLSSLRSFLLSLIVVTLDVYAAQVGRYELGHNISYKNACVFNEDLDHPVLSHNLTRVFAVCLKTLWLLRYPRSALR